MLPDPAGFLGDLERAFAAVNAGEPLADNLLPHPESQGT